MNSTKNALEKLLYSNNDTGFKSLKLKSMNGIKQPHPYCHGLYLSINHNCSTKQIIDQYERIYRIVFSTFTGNIIVPDEIYTKNSVPQKRIITKLLKRNLPVMTSSIHCFDYKKQLSDGRFKCGKYYHSHHHFYRIHNLMPNNRSELRDKVQELRENIQHHIKTTNKKHLLVKVQPCGTGSNIDDRITDDTYWDYLNTEANGINKTLLTYFVSQSPVQCDTSLRFTYTV